MGERIDTTSSMGDLTVKVNEGVCDGCIYLSLTEQSYGDKSLSLILNGE